jgi:hypothetical protein
MSTRDYVYSRQIFSDDKLDMSVEAGEVWRMKSEDAMDTFTSCTVLGIAEGQHGNFWVRLARPYCFASGVGTTGPTALLGCEVFEVTTTQFFERFKRQSNSHYLVNP